MVAKAGLGTALAFGQALLIAAVTGTLAHVPGLVIVTLLLGALLATGFGLLAGASGKDFVGIVFLSMLLFVPLVIPAFAVLFPGTPALWIRMLPSYGLVEVLIRTAARGEGWAGVWPYLAALASWCGVVLAIGTSVLAWRVRRL